MRFENDHQSFELEILGQDGGLDGGLQWLQVAIAVRVENERFHASGAWLTTVERDNLLKFLSLAAKRIPGNINFIEPNLAFEYDSETARLKIALALEAKPKWLASGELLFVASEKTLIMAAQEI